MLNEYTAGVSGTNRRYLSIMEEPDMLRKICRGDMFYADLRPVIGSEQGGVRPVLVIQNDIGNMHSPTIIVAAMSGNLDKTKLPTHYQVNAYAGLKEESVVLLEQIRTIDKKRLKDYIGRLCRKDMDGIDQCIILSLELNKCAIK